MTLHGRHTEDEQAMKPTVETVGIGHSYAWSVLICLGVLFATGCQAADQPVGGDASGPLQSPGQKSGTSITNSNVAHTTEWSYGSFTACFPAGPVPVVLTSMELLKPTGQVRIASTGVKVDDGRSSVGVIPGALPTDYRPLRAIAQDEASRLRCEGGSEVVQTAVSVSAPGHWEADGMRLNYQAEGKDYVVDWHVRLVHCAPRGDTSEACLKSSTP